MHRHRFLAVDPAVGSLFFDPHPDGGNVLQQHRHRGLDHDVFQVPHTAVFGNHINVIYLVRLADVADIGFILVVAGNRRPDIRGTDPVGVGRFILDDDLDRLLPPAEHLHAGNAVDRFQIRGNFSIDQMTHPVDAALAAHLQVHEHVGKLFGVDFLHHRKIIFRKGAPHFIDLFLKLQVGVFKVHLCGVIDENGPAPLVGVRLYLVDSFQGAHRPFQRNDRLPLQLKRIAVARAVNLDDQERQLHRRQQFHRQVAVGNIAQQGKSQEEHADGGFTANREIDHIGKDKG